MRLDPAEIEDLFARRLLSRRQFARALIAAGVTVAGVEGLLGADWGAAEATVAPEDRYLVLIVMDGFRADYRSLAPMHHLHALMARGTFYDTAWVGHLESETPSGHATIATGAYPNTHSVIGFGWRNVQDNNFTYMPTNLPQIRAGALTRSMAAGGVPTIAELIHARRSKDVVVSMSGEKYYASATMGAGADYVFYGADDKKQVFRPVSIGPSTPPPGPYDHVAGTSDFASQDAFVADLAVDVVRTLKPRALLVNLPDTDIAGHYYGGMIDPRDMTGIIKNADAAIGKIVNEYQRLGLLDRTVFVVTADHGMAANRHIPPVHPMYKAVAHSSSGSLDEEFRISMGSVWLRQLGDAEAVAAALATGKFTGVEGALYKVASGTGWTFEPDKTTQEKLPAKLLDAYLRLAQTEACPAGPEVIMPYAADTVGLVLHTRKRWGQHGGFSFGVQEIPIVLAGPGVNHTISHFPAKLVDVAPTIERLLDLPVPNGVDGVVLADAIQGSKSQDRAAQESVASIRLGDRETIKAHSLSQSPTG